MDPSNKHSDIIEISQPVGNATISMPQSSIELPTATGDIQPARSTIENTAVDTAARIKAASTAVSTNTFNRVAPYVNKRLAIVIAGGLTGAALAPILAPPVLGLVGFSAAGPVAGGVAAGIQAGIGNVAAGSAFAVAQSVAAGGALPAIGYIFAAGISGGVAAGAANLKK